MQTTPLLLSCPPFATQPVKLLAVQVVCAKAWWPKKVKAIKNNQAKIEPDNLKKIFCLFFCFILKPFIA
jgi:hypothetical protein